MAALKCDIDMSKHCRFLSSSLRIARELSSVLMILIHVNIYAKLLCSLFILSKTGYITDFQPGFCQYTQGVRQLRAHSILLYMKCVGVPSCIFIVNKSEQ